MSYVFVSGWRRTQGQGGLTQYFFDDTSGECKMVQSFFEQVKINVTCLDEKKNILYAISEVPDLPGLRFGGGGTLYALFLDETTGRCVCTQTFPLYCTNPANMSISKDGKYILISGHGTKSYVTQLVQDAFGEYRPVVLVDDTPVMLLERNEDGSIGRILDVKKHTGSGPSPKQLTPHPHSATRSPSGKLFAVCDKGNDHIFMYRIDEETNKLVLCSTPYALGAGTEPRYCVYHPTLPYLYVNSESLMEMFVFHYTESGELTLVGSYPALEDTARFEQCKKKEQQDLRIDASGSYLYTVLNGPDQIAVFKINQEDGALELVQNAPVNFEWPRGATLSPNGKFLLVTCCQAGKIVVYRVGEDGLLTGPAFVCDQDNAAYATFWK